MTQGECVFNALRLRPHTYLEMLRILGGGLSPWKRLSEYMELHGKGWKVVRAKNADGWTTWRVRRAK